MARASLPPSLKDLSWLEELTFEQLAKLADAMPAQCQTPRSSRTAPARTLDDKARLFGIDPVDLLPSHKARVNRSEVKPKYRDTHDPTLTWSGRGRPPRWLQERIAAGEKKDDYLIQ